ncbi:MAG: hypothetical protein Q8L98_08120 [Chlamydiales bacterium]|nr:hypothetical protein [Chlamydiales bacterium]
MNSIIEIKKIHEPAIYHRDYENDFPKKDEVKNKVFSQCLRVTQVALPFISLYKPLGQPLSVVLGSARVISSVAQMVDAISSKDSNAIRKTVIETAIATTALACSIFAHPLGMIVSTAHDMVTNVTELIQAVQNKDYKRAAEIGLHLTNNALYLGCFFAGSLEWSIASIGFQIFLGIYNSCDELKKGNYFEGCGHMLMAGIHGKQMHDQIQLLQFQKKIEKILLTLKSQINENASNASETTIKSSTSKEIRIKQAKIPSKNEIQQTNTSIELKATKAVATTEEAQELTDILMKYGNNKYGWSALNYAINCEDYNAANILIKNGADCFKSDKNYFNSYLPIERLFMTPCNKHKPVGSLWRLKPFPENKQESAKILLNTLLQQHVLHKNNAKTFSHEDNILKGLIINKWHDQLEYLFESKYILHPPHSIHWNSLYKWLVDRKDLETMSVLDNLFSPSELKDYRITLEARLTMAIEGRSLEMVKHFVECGASVKGTLNAAAKAQNKDIIEFLISKGATL